MTASLRMGAGNILSKVVVLCGCGYDKRGTETTTGLPTPDADPATRLLVSDGAQAEVSL